MRLFRAQSAMEYLMTYGWAILIIAVVLGALFALGVFNSAAFLGTACIGQSGFLCQMPTLNATSGALSFSFGQSNGYTIYNVEISCTATQAPTGGPSNITSYNCPYTLRACGYPNTRPIANWGAIGNATFPSGVQTQISDLECFTSAGVPIGTNGISLGQTYTGTLWVNYSTSPTAKPSIVAQVATIAVKAS